MDSASELADGIADLADGVAELADSVAELADGVAELADCVAELADGVITKHGTALHGTRLPRTTRFRKKMQLSAKLGYIHCDAKDVIAGVPSRGARFLRMHACAAENPRCRVLVTNLNEKGCEKGVQGIHCNRTRRSGVLGVE
jgi:X-X-X-Leu-X-X-Gly heptad repeat protein